MAIQLPTQPSDRLNVPDPVLPDKRPTAVSVMPSPAPTECNVPSGSTGYYFVVIAVGNFLGPLLLGHLFDTVGRKPMITGTYVLSGLLLFGPLLWQHWQRTRLGVGRSSSSGGGGGPRRSSGAMSRQEAYEVLGLRPGATEAEIRAAHRRLMRAAHPDGGGSDWVASRVNQARDILLG